MLIDFLGASSSSLAAPKMFSFLPFFCFSFLPNIQNIEREEKNKKNVGNFQEKIGKTRLMNKFYVLYLNLFSLISYKSEIFMKILKLGNIIILSIIK